MVRIIKNYFKIHFKHSFIYITTLVTMFFGLIISAFLTYIMGGAGVDSLMAWAISIVIGSVIASSPLIIPNVDAAIEFSRQKQNPNRFIAIYSVSFQVISILTYSALVYVLWMLI